MKKQIRKYVMKNCGCVLEKNELTEHKTTGYRCPHHPDNGVEYIDVECIDCHRMIRTTPLRASTRRCPECREEINRKRNRAAYKKKNSRKPPAQVEVAAAVNAYDCIHRDECLKKVLIESPLAKILPCYKCERYRPSSTIEKRWAS